MEGWRKYFIRKFIKVFFFTCPLYFHSIFQFILFFFFVQENCPDSINFFDRRSSPSRSPNEYSAGPKISLFLFLREKSVLVSDSKWRVDNWPIVARPPWTVAFAYGVSREGAERGGGQRGEQRKGVSTRISRSSRERAREGPDLWMGPDPRGGQRCRLAESGTTLVPGSTNRWLVSPLSSRLFPLFVLSFSFSFLLLAQLPISIPHRLPSFSFSFFNFFLFSRSLVLVAEDALTLVACVLLGTYLSSIMRRRLSWNYCGQIGRVLSWFLLPD